MTDRPLPNDPYTPPHLRPPAGRLAAAARFVRTHLLSFVTTTAVGVLTLFSGTIVEQVKFRLNRADLRTTRYEAVARDLSSFTFAVELVEEFFRNHWTTLKTLEWLIDYYNKAVTRLRESEHVYRQWLGHYWGPEQIKRFDRIMADVRAVDAEIHKLNDELERVQSDNKNHPKVDPARSQAAAAVIAGRLPDLRGTVGEFLDDLR